VLTLCGRNICKLRQNGWCYSGYHVIVAFMRFYIYTTLNACFIRFNRLAIYSVKSDFFYSYFCLNVHVHAYARANIAYRVLQCDDVINGLLECCRFAVLAFSVRFERNCY